MFSILCDGRPLFSPVHLLYPSYWPAVLWNKCCELARNATSPHSPLTPSIFIMHQLLPKIVIAMPLSVREKPWHFDRVLAQAITQRCGLLTRLLPVHPEPTEGRVERLKGRVVREERRGHRTGEKRCYSPLPEFQAGVGLCWSRAESWENTVDNLSHPMRWNQAAWDWTDSRYWCVVWAGEWTFVVKLCVILSARKLFDHLHHVDRGDSLPSAP